MSGFPSLGERPAICGDGGVEVADLGFVSAQANGPGVGAARQGAAILQRVEHVFAVQAEIPDTKWTADITYVWTAQGWLYLAVILDLFSRRIAGWAMAQTIDRTLVLSALSMAILGRKPGSDRLCHSDRGSQYASEDYIHFCPRCGLVLDRDTNSARPILKIAVGQYSVPA